MIRLAERLRRRSEQDGTAEDPENRILVELMIYHAERYRAESSNRQHRQEVPPRREANPAREREPWENIVQTGAWSSEEVQRSLTRLREEEPETSEWNQQAADLLLEYQEQLEKTNDERAENGEPPLNLVAHLDTISDALKAEGSIYEAVVRERSLSASPQSQ